MTYSVKFWNRIARKYAAQPVANEAVYQRKLEESQRYFEPDMKVFEFGCGTGSTALLHAPMVGSYEATDVSPAMIEIAQEKLTNSGISNLQFSISAIEDFDGEECSYDVVLGLNILHLLDDPRAALIKVNRLLKPGGLFISSTACIKDMMPLFGLIAPIGAFFGMIPKVSIFNREHLLAMHDETGFAIIFDLEKNTKREGDFLIARKRA